MGYGAVVVLVNLLRMTWNAKLDQKLFASMSKVNAGFLLAYVIIRVGDIAVQGKLKYLGANFYTALFLVEMALFLAPAFMFLSKKVQENRGRLFGAALLTLWAGAAYRVDTYLSVYRPGPGWEYWPSLGETTVTVGMAAIGMAVFIFISRKFPVVVVEDHAHASTTVGAPRAAAS
jgi:Ni/Fe-hydrogenase subunit HybB-like protein